jgi:hypothetical protein
MIVNLEEIHSNWLDGMATFCKNYLVEKHGKELAIGAVLELAEGEEGYVFNCLGAFDLPSGSSRLIMHMARFTKCSFCPPDEVRGCDFYDFDEFPDTTFCLGSLLSSAFPKTIETDCFKAHDGAIDVGETKNPKTAFRRPHVAFSGLGIILIEELRSILDPLAPNADVIKLADKKYLCVFEPD